MLKNVFFSVPVLILLCFVSCASTTSSDTSIKKGKKEYTLSDHYIFDEQGHETFFEGYEKLGDYDEPNLWNAESRQAEYDDNGRLIRAFLDGDRTYPEERFYSYDEEGNLIPQEDLDFLSALLEGYEKSDMPVFEATVPDGTWEKYDSAGRLIYERDFHGNEIWYDNQGRIIRYNFHYMEYDEQGHIIYERFDENTVSQIWRGFDKEGRACWFKELETNKFSPDWDQSREIKVTYDKEGFSTYIIETIIKHLNSEEINYICTERFYINKYTYFENGQMSECRQYRYLNRTDEWIPNPDFDL